MAYHYHASEADEQILALIQKECSINGTRCFLVDCKLSPFSYVGMKKDDWIPGVLLYKQGECRALNLTNERECATAEVSRINFSLAKGNKLYRYIRAPGSTDDTAKLWKNHAAEYLVTILSATFFNQTAFESSLKSMVLQLCEFLSPTTVLLFCSQHKKFSVTLVHSLLTTFPFLLHREKNDLWHKTYQQIFALITLKGEFEQALLISFCDTWNADEKFFNKCFSACLRMELGVDVCFSCLQKLFSLGFVCPAKYPHELLAQGMKAPNCKNFFKSVTFLLENGAKPIYRLTEEFIPPPAVLDKDWYRRQPETMATENYQELHEKHRNFASWMVVTQQCEERRECKLEILLELDVYFPRTIVEIITAFLPWWSVVELTPLQQRLLKLLIKH